MSLLLEALRKAEEAKRLASEPPLGTAASELTLAPLSEPTPASPQPNLSQHDAALEAELPDATREKRATRRAPAATPTPSDTAALETARRSAQRATARNAFTAKAPPRPRRALWLTLALAASVALGIGAYLWWQLQSVAGGSLSRPVQALAPTPAPPPVSAAVTAPVTQPAASVTAPATIPTPPASIAPSAAPESPALFEPRVRPSRPSPPAVQAAPASPLRLSKTPTQAPLERAYDSLQAGRLDEAQSAYEQVLRSDAKSTDALLGLATIAARQGLTELAQGYYRRALETDPNDATAQAGLINTRGQADPGLSESRLKSALGAQPESSALHFALGNLYARQSRWSEAQQAYFRAYSGEPDNADFIFNLAVSLDHLHQNRLAAQYYQMALGSPRVQHSSFDQAQVKQRILELQP